MEKSRHPEIYSGLKFISALTAIQDDSHYVSIKYI